MYDITGLWNREHQGADGDDEAERRGSEKDASRLRIRRAILSGRQETERQKEGKEERRQKLAAQDKSRSQQRVGRTERAGVRRKVKHMQHSSNPQARTDKQERVAALRAKAPQRQSTAHQRSRSGKQEAESIEGLTAGRKGIDTRGIRYRQERDSRSVHSSAYRITLQSCQHR